MNDNDRRLEDRYNAAAKKIGQQLGTGQGGANAESEYGIAYQRLVQAGLRGQIKKKYRS